MNEARFGFYSGYLAAVVMGVAIGLIYAPVIGAAIFYVCTILVDIRYALENRT